MESFHPQFAHRGSSSIVSATACALLLLADAVALFLLLKFAILPWMSSSGEARAALPVKEKTLRKYQQMVALTGTREMDWKAIQARVAEAEKRLLSGRTPALASAEMQELVRQMLSQQGIEVRAADFLPVRPVKLGSAEYLMVPVSVNFECKLDQVVNFMNVARGGTLVQDIPSQIAGAIEHRLEAPPHEPFELAHEVWIDKGSRLAARAEDGGGAHLQRLGAHVGELHLQVAALAGGEGAEIERR